MPPWTKRHDPECHACHANLTVVDSVCVHFSAADQEFDRLSCLDAHGFLVDVDRLIENGYHAGSHCRRCGTLLDEIEMAPSKLRVFKASTIVAQPDDLAPVSGQRCRGCGANAVLCGDDSWAVLSGEAFCTNCIIAALDDFKAGVVDLDYNLWPHLRLALRILEPFKENSSYEDYQREDEVEFAWSDADYDNMLTAFKDRLQASGERDGHN